MKKGFKYVKMILNIVIVTLVLSFVFVVCLQRFSNNEISFFNYRIFTVVSGSMVPKYSIGDVLVAKKVDADKIKVGDAVSYLGDRGQFTNKVVTHDVIRIIKCTDNNDTDEIIITPSDEINDMNSGLLSKQDKKMCINIYGSLNNRYLFETKGVANLTSDPIVREDQIYGKIIHKNVFLSFMYGLVAKPIGMLIFVIVPVFYVIGSEFLTFLLEKEEERREKDKKKKSDDKIVKEEKSTKKVKSKKNE